MESKQPSRAHRQLMSELKRVREDANLSGQRLGELLNWSQSKVSKIENGRTRPSMNDIEAWAGACSLSEEDTANLLDIAEGVVSESRPWTARHGSLASRNSAIGQTEQEMTGLRNFQPAVFPGLLQTADYARRVITFLDVAGQRDVAAAVAVRMERQAVLYDTSKQFEFILTEAAIRWRPGPRSLMLAQLDRLKSVATMPNVTIGIIPLNEEATALCLGGFTIFESPDQPYVLIECLATEHKLHDENEIAKYAVILDGLRGTAAMGADALTLIDEIRNEISGQID